jgi:predicted RNA-binding protein with PIN domain
MSGQWILVDGYSVMHSWKKLRRPAGRSLEQRREALLSELQQYADHTGQRVTVVFDGYAAKHQPESTTKPGEVEVLFSTKNKTADDLIERQVGQAARPDQIQVVTSDNVERQIVEGLGAASVSSETFELEVARVLAELGEQVREHGPRRRLNTLRGHWGG